MKKVKLANTVLVTTIVGGIALWYFFNWSFVGGFISGSSCSILLFSLLGRQQMKKAEQLINKQIRDIILQNE